MNATLKKRKRTVLTLSQKLELCQRFNAGVDKQVLMDDYKIGSSTLYDIKNREAEWMTILKTSNRADMRVRYRYRVRRTKMDDLENVLHEWLLAKRKDGLAVTGPMLVDRAKEISEEMNLQEHESCTFSCGWLARFKVRFKIDKLKMNGPPKVVDKIALETSSEDSDVVLERPENGSGFLDDEPKMEVVPKVEMDFDFFGWEEAASAFSTLVSFAGTKVCFSLEEIEQLKKLHVVFLEKMSECKTLP